MFLAFHFALRLDDADDNSNSTPETDPSAKLDFANQKLDILRMSHGVAIVLIISQLPIMLALSNLHLRRSFIAVYGAYLIFQLYSHTHLYKDTAEGSKSRRFSARPPNKVLQRLVRLPSVKKSIHTHTRSSSLTLRGSSSAENSDTPMSPISPTSPKLLKPDTSLDDVDAQDTIKLVHKDDCVWDNVSYLYRTPSRSSDVSDDEMITEEERKQQEKEEVDKEKAKEPKLSWFMTIFLLLSVTVVSHLFSE